MSEEAQRLNEIANFFQRMNNKILLLRLLNRAKEEYEKYDYDTCIETLVNAYELNPNNPVVLRGLGCAEQFRKNFDKSLLYFKKALEYSKTKEIEYTLIGMSYYLQDKLDDAVEYFNLAIDTNDNYEHAYEGRNQAMLERHLKIIDLQEVLKKYF